MSELAVDPPIPALFIAHETALRESGGGVQRCNLEYMTGLSAAGFSLTEISFDYERRFDQRVLRRLNPVVSQQSPPVGLYRRTQQAIVDTKAAYVFFSLSLFSELSSKLRDAFPSLRQILLSHGVEAIDFSIEQDIRRRTSSQDRPRRVAERMLGRELLEAMEARRSLDAVVALSPLDAEVEKWLGASRVMWTPRVISEEPLASRAVGGRVGCVSTLNHPPNLSGLINILDELLGRASDDFRFRLIGGPRSLGADLAKRYPFVDYLGPLSDEDLRIEASSWCCFVHPMFVYAKGCSMKLATALGWGLPIATTAYGARGYAWDTGSLPLANSPAELAKLVVDRASSAKFSQYAAETRKIAGLAPTAPQSGLAIRRFLEGGGVGAISNSAVQ